MTLRNITCAVTLCLLTLSGQAVGKTEVPPYKNKSLSIEKRSCPKTKEVTVATINIKYP